MADVRAFRSGNWSDTTATSPWWNGTAIFAPAAGDVVYSNNFIIAIDQNITTGTITNSSATSRTWKDGGTAAITSTTGGYTIAGTFAVNTNIIANNSGTACLTISSGSSTVNGNVTGATLSTPQALLHSGTGTLSVSGTVTGSTSPNACEAIRNSSTGTISITGNVTGGTSNINYGCNNSSTGTISITGNVTGGGTSGIGVINSSAGTMSITGNVTAGSAAAGANNSSTGIFTVIGNITATNGASGFTSANSSATNRLSGSFISSANGTAAIYAAKYILNSTPLLAKTRYALNGISTYVDMFTADNNSAGGVATTDVRSGVSYGGGLVGTCAVPNPGTVAFGVAVDNTTGTATLTAANVRDALGMASANLDTQLAVLSNLDTTVSSRLAPSGTLARVTLTDTATTLTNAPASVTPAQIRAEMDTNSTKLANLDATVSSRLASSVSTNITAIKAKTDLLNTDRLAQCATTSIVGNLIAQSNS